MECLLVGKGEKEILVVKAERAGKHTWKRVGEKKVGHSEAYDNVYARFDSKDEKYLYRLARHENEQMYSRLG